MSNLEVSVDQFIKMYPREITVYAMKFSGFLGEREAHNYRLSFSKEGTLRDTKYLKKDFPTSVVLYQQIVKEFLEQKYLTSIAYDDKKVKGTVYHQIKLMNNKEERLNVGYTDALQPEFEKTSTMFHNRKKDDYILYAKGPIEKKVVDKLTIRNAINPKSNVVYVPNNDSPSPFIGKRRQLGYYYPKVDGKIPEEDSRIIIDLLRYFVNCHLEEKPYYHYEINGKWQTEALKIISNTGREIEILDNDLIDIIEKDGFIDDLKRLKDGKIKEMSKINHPSLQKTKSL